MEKTFLNLPVSNKMALISFGLGTILFLSYFIIKENMFLIVIGFYYIIIASIINVFMLAKLVFDWIKLPFERKKIIIQILILLANIPIAFAYLSILVYSVTSNSPF